jgi:glycerol-3-phosphate dehydrogenase (NAD(P)+)
VSALGRPAAVLGAGSWGTALAILLGRGSGTTEVRLWCRDRAHAERLQADRANERYLPGAALPAPVRPVASLEEALDGAGLVVGAVPSSATAEVARLARPLIGEAGAWLSAAKGLEQGSHRRMSEVVHAELPELAAVAVLSGPSFAVEVAAGQPTAVVVACEDLEVARRLQAEISDETFRAYASHDVVGVELGGAIKNVIAIAAGLLTGLGLGHDPTAALVTRGLAEMSRLAAALGADPRTMSGLAGLGDLVLTCTGSLSRNRRLGEAVARGASVEEAAAALGQVAEGVETTRRVLAIADEHGLDVPITRAVDEVLFGGTAPAEAVRQLMRRDLKDELP